MLVTRPRVNPQLRGGPQANQMRTDRRKTTGKRNASPARYNVQITVTLLIFKQLQKIEQSSTTNRTPQTAIAGAETAEAEAFFSHWQA